MISGSVFHFGESATPEPGNVPGESSQPRNPLICYLCKDYFSEPCLLSCFHTFCSRCLQNKSTDNKVSCPTCGATTMLKDNCQLPPPDTVMRHLIDLANTDNPPCSNCDKRDRPSMFFCNTCGQALCTQCRENTHRAKMFSTHEVVHMSKCAKDGHRRCPVHGEQYIMFSNSQRNMLCVNCFRDTPAEARLHCVDIDTAYTQGCKNLERSLMSVREIQGLVRTGVLSCRTLLEELHHNTNTEKSTIHSFCQGMQEAIAKTQAAMLLEVQRQYESKERVLHSQLMSLSGVIPVLQAHLLLCHTFSSMATKFQFLDLVYPMIDRLNAVSQLTQPIRPLQTSQIRTNYKSEFAQSLEPWIGKPLPPIPASQTGGGTESSQGGQQQVKQGPKLKPIDEGHFTNHCRTFESQMKELGGEVSGVRERLSQLQRDVAVIKRAALQPLLKRHNSIARDCARLDSTLQRYHQELERARGTFETSWQDQLRRIRLEQDIFQSQISEVVRVRCEVKQLANVAQELEPSVKRLSSQAMEDFSALVSAHSADLKHLMEHGSHKGGSTQTLDKTKDLLCEIGSKGDHYGRAQDHRIRGVISHLMEKVRTKEDHRKKSPVQEDRGGIVPRELSKDRKESIASTKSASSAREGKVADGKACTLYHSHSAKGSQQQISGADEAALLVKKCIQDHLEEQMKQKLLQSQRQKPPKQKEFPDEDSDYQHISEATTARVHKSPTYHPHSDTEDSVFYPDTPSSGRRSSTDVMDRRKTLVVVINKGNRLMQKQRSWETFPPKRRGGNNSKFCRDPDSFRDTFNLNGLKKADSFEGHEEAVRTLVAAVQETRTLRKPKSTSAVPPSSDSAPA